MPLFRRARIRLQQVRNRQSGAQHGAMAAIEEKQLKREAVAQAGRHAAPEVIANPDGAEPLAFEAEEGDLVKRIDGAEPRIELQAVDDPDRVAEKDVLGTQVAVPVEDAAVPDPPGQPVAPLREEAALDGVDAPHQSRRQAESRIEQDAPVVPQALAPVVEMECRKAQDRRGAARR